MIDLNLLRIVKHRKDFFMLRGRVPAAAMDKQTNALLADFGHYFDQLSEHERIDHATFLPIFRARHPALNDEQRNAFEGIIKNALSADVGQNERDSIVRSLLELRLGTDLANLVEKFDAGDLPNIRTEIEQALTEYKADANITGLDWIRDDIGDLLQEEISDSGLRWRMTCLNEHMRGLRGGDFGIIAGRPDRGKTTLIASELTALAPQLPPNTPAIWLNNEGPGKRIIPRLYQAALGLTTSEMIAMHQRGLLKAAYTEAMGGMTDRIRVIDVHNVDNFTVEAIVEKHAPGLVIYDMIDNIRGFGDAARTDLGLEKMYQWARELAVQYDHAAIATSQISADGEGMQFPSQSMLKDSKTGKQGACDFIIMAGASNDPGLQGLRYIGLTKNKLRREGKPSDPRATVKYEPQKARYSDIPVASDDLGAENGSE